MLKEKEFSKQIILSVEESFKVVRYFNRRCLEKVLFQQHVQYLKKVPYVNFSFDVYKIIFHESTVLLKTDSGNLEVIIAPYLSDIVSCRISYRTHDNFGGWWVEIGEMRFIFQCSYESIMEIMNDEQKL